MRRATLRIGLSLVFGLVLLFGASTAQAQEKYQTTNVTVTWKDGDGHVHSEKFDLSKTDDYNKVEKLLKDRQVVSIAEEEPVSILALSADLGIWTVVVFLLLFFILRKAAWKPMLEGLQRREENIHGALSEAQRAREEAKTLRDSLQKELDKASDKVREMIDAARRDGLKVKDDMLAEAKAVIAGERDRATRELQMAKDQALQELWSQTAQLATLVSAKTIRRQLSTEDHRQLVDDALAEMRGSMTAKRQEMWGDKV